MHKKIISPCISICRTDPVTGTFYGQCSELCGIKHAFMPITVNVVTEEEYNQWLEKAKVEFAKEEINNNIKVAKKIKEIK